MRIRNARPYRTSHLRRAIDDTMDSLKSETRRAAERTRDQIEDKPLAALLGALVAGALLGHFLWRR